MRTLVAMALLSVFLALPVFAADPPSPRGTLIAAVDDGEKVYLGVVGRQTFHRYPCRIITLKAENEITIRFDYARDAEGYYDGEGSETIFYGEDGADYEVDTTITLVAGEKKILTGTMNELEVVDGSAGGYLYVWCEY